MLLYDDQALRKELKEIKDIFMGEDIIAYLVRFPLGIQYPKKMIRYKLVKIQEIVERSSKLVRTMFLMQPNIARYTLKCIKAKYNYLKKAVEGILFKQIIYSMYIYICIYLLYI